MPHLAFVRYLSVERAFDIGDNPPRTCGLRQGRRPGRQSRRGHRHRRQREWGDQHGWHDQRDWQCDGRCDQRDWRRDQRRGVRAARVLALAHEVRQKRWQLNDKFDHAGEDTVTKERRLMDKLFLSGLLDCVAVRARGAQHLEQA